MADLIVELYGNRVGRLTGDTRTFDFVTEPAAVKHFGLDSPILSVAIPLALAPTRAHRVEDIARFARNLLEGRPAGPPAL